MAVDAQVARALPVEVASRLFVQDPASRYESSVTEHSNRSSSPDRRDERISRLFDEHYRGLCRLAGLVLGDSTAAEEVVQEAFLRTFSGWWRVRHPERAQWYLRTSVLNICRSRLRRRTTEERGNRVSWNSSYGSGAASHDESAMSDESMMLVELVRRLPARQRDAVVLRYYEDLSEAEIARVLGCAIGTVKSQLAKARSTLARALEQGSEDDEVVERRGAHVVVQGAAEHDRSDRSSEHDRSDGTAEHDRSDGTAEHDRSDGAAEHDRSREGGSGA